MQKIESKEMAFDYLKRNEIIMTTSRSTITYFAMVDKQKIRVYCEQSNYFLNTDQFIALFGEETFYLYENKQEDELVSLEKDDEYYRWRQ